MLAILTPLAALAAIASDLPRGLAWPLAALALLHGARLLRIEWRKSVRSVLITAAGAVTIDGAAAQGFLIQWRGPLAFMRWHDGRRVQRLVWWPDTLPAGARRELRLAAPAMATARTANSMAT